MVPERFEIRMRQMLGEEFAQFKAAYQERGVRSFYINEIKCGGRFEFGSPLFAFDTVPRARVFDGEGIGSHPYHAAGLLYAQEASAMLPALSFEMPRAAAVLDMCAAPGGKTGQLACRLGGEGVLVSNEYDRNRAAILKENVTRMGYTNVCVTNMFPERIAESLGGFFDVVVVDAPCSGEGMFRKNPDAMREWSEAHVVACAARQKEIVATSAKCLKTGGLLVYSTCTFSREEDEDVVEYALGLGFEQAPVRKEIAALGTDTGLGIKFFPHRFGEGQFVSVLRKTARAAPAKKLTARAAPAKKSTLAAISEIMDISDLTIAETRDVVYVATALPPPFDFAVKLGETECDKRFTPAHGLFTAYGNRVLTRISMTEPELTAYLRGEELTKSAPNGWAALTWCGYAVGGTKVAAGILKNKYPKALRTK